MSQKEEKIYFGLLCIIGILIASFIIYSVIYPIEINDKNRKVDYTIRWIFEEGEMIELNENDLVYDKNDHLLLSDTKKENNVCYKLSKGEYKLVTKNVKGKLIEIKIIVK